TEHDDVKDLTFELVRALGDEFPGGPQLGCVVQAYRKDSYADLRDLVAWSKSALRIPLQIRLVKGAYWDYETVVARAEGWPVPVFEEKAQTDANYERCVRHLIDNAGAVRPAFASHNLRSLAYGLAAARAAGLADGAVELQMLYGMAGPVHAALRSLGQRVRVYAPVGELVPGMAYLVRRLLENTSNESFLRQRSADGKELRHLIRPPRVKDRDLPDADPEAPVRPPTDPADPGPFDNEPPAELRRITPRARLLAALMVFEAGKPIREADGDVAEAIDFCEYYGREALRLGAGVPILQAPGETNTYRYQPRGVGVVIAPWNFPLAIPCGMVSAALV